VRPPLRAALRGPRVRNRRPSRRPDRRTEYAQNPHSKAHTPEALGVTDGQAQQPLPPNRSPIQKPPLEKR